MDWIGLHSTAELGASLAVYFFWVLWLMGLMTVSWSAAPFDAGDPRVGFAILVLMFPAMLVLGFDFSHFIDRLWLLCSYFIVFGLVFFYVNSIDTGKDDTMERLSGLGLVGFFLLLGSVLANII